MQVTLVVVGGDAKTKEIRLKLPTIVGRGKGSTLRLPHALVSRQHCEIFLANGKLMVRDLGSLNGTYINNQRVTEAEMPAGELLSIGTVTFRAVYNVDPDQSPPGADPHKTVPVTKTGETIHEKEPAVESPAPASPGVPAPSGAAVAEEPIDFSSLIGEVEDDLEDFDTDNETKNSPVKATAPPVETKQLLPVAVPVQSAVPADKPAKPAREPATIGPPPAVDKPASPPPSSSDDDLSSFLKSLGK